MFKKQINRLSKGKDKNIRTCLRFKAVSCHKIGHMKFSLHHEMRRDAAS